MTNSRKSSRTTSIVEPISDESLDYGATASDVGTGNTASTSDQRMQEAGRKASDAAERVVDSARSSVTDQANIQKERAADTVDQLAQAIGHVSDDLQGQQPMVAAVAETAAEQTERIGQFLRENDVNQIVRNTEDFARRQPMLFYGGAFVLGLALARVLKAGGSAISSSSNGQNGATSKSTVDTRTGLTVGG